MCDWMENEFDILLLRLFCSFWFLLPILLEISEVWIDRDSRTRKWWSIKLTWKDLDDLLWRRFKYFSLFSSDKITVISETSIIGKYYITCRKHVITYDVARHIWWHTSVTKIERILPIGLLFGSLCWIIVHVWSLV